jgi:hypothetical protein
LAAVCITGLAIGALIMGISCYCWCQRFRCCRGDQAHDRRGQRRTRTSSRKRSASCGLLCCCRSRDEQDTQDTAVRWRRGQHSDGDEVGDSEDEITMIAAGQHRYPGTTKTDASLMRKDLRQAEVKVVERLDSLNRGPIRK